MVAIDRKVQWYLWQYGRQVDVIEMWLLLTGKHSCVSGSIVDRWVLLLGGCCRRISIVVSLVVW